MRKTVIEITRILHGVITLLIIMALISALADSIGEDQKSFMLDALSVLIPFFVSIFAAEKCRSFFSFFPLCLLSLTAPFFMASGTINKVLCLVPSVFTIILRIVKRMKGQHDGLTSPHAAMFAVFAAIYVITVLLDNAFAGKIIYYALFAYVMDYMVYLNLTSLERYLIFNDSVANIPHRQIAGTNRGLLIVYLALTAAAMLLLPLSGLDRLIKKIGRLILDLIRRLLSGAGIEEPIEEMPAESFDLAGMFGAIETKETPEWLRVFLDILQYTLIAIVTLALLFLIGYAIYRFIKRFYRPSSDTDDVTEFISPLKDKKESLLSEAGRSKPLWRSFDPASAVRKLYRRTIIKKAKSIPTDAFTPEELENYARIEKSAERNALHALYEKARYSEKSISKEEVRSLHT